MLVAVLLLVWPYRSCFAQYFDFDPLAEEMMEAEALIEALDDFGLNLESPELEGMDGGDMWAYLDYLHRMRGRIKNKSDHIVIYKDEEFE